MSDRGFRASVICLVIAAFATVSAAVPIEIGSGASTSSVLIEFDGDRLFEFAVSYDDTGDVTGEDLLAIMADDSATDFEYLGRHFEFGGVSNLFIFGMSFAGISQGILDDFSSSPSYYLKPQADQPWGFAPVGPSTRIVTDGTVDGWTFSERAIPEPGAATILLLGAIALGRRQRRRVGGGAAAAVIAVVLVTPPAEAATPWATEVQSFEVGANPVDGYTDDPSVVLGEPTRFTAEGTPFGGQVSGFNPPFATNEILSIGAGGSLTVGFDHSVLDNPPDIQFGIDLLIFGNALYQSNVDGTALSVAAEPARIEVSQTGAPGSWIEIPDVFADDRFPTEAYLDASGPFASDGTTRSRFTIPVDPDFDPIGRTYRQIVNGYAGSGGGTGVDIGPSGLPWIRYVRLTQNPLDDHSTEVDAFADVVPEPSAVSLVTAAMIFMLASRRRIDAFELQAD